MENKRKPQTHEEAMEQLRRQIKADTRKPITFQELAEIMRKRREAASMEESKCEQEPEPVFDIMTHFSYSKRKDNERKELSESKKELARKTLELLKKSRPASPAHIEDYPGAEIIEDFISERHKKPEKNRRNNSC